MRCFWPVHRPLLHRTSPDEQLENLVRRSWQYVAMYNVNNKGAMQYGGWNIVDVDTKLKDHTLKLIARPNNDSLYITCHARPA